MSFVPRFTATGAPPFTRSYAIAASEEWDMWDVLALNGDAALLEAASAAADVLGSAPTKVGNTTTGQADAEDLRSYLAAQTTGKHTAVVFFTRQTFFETDDYNAAGTAVVGDVGGRADLELVSGDWGINQGTSGTTDTPNFAIMDIIRVRSTFLVIPDPVAEVVVHQFFDASV